MVGLKMNAIQIHAVFFAIKVNRFLICFDRNNCSTTIPVGDGGRPICDLFVSCGDRCKAAKEI
jgi:hypothetical protein